MRITPIKLVADNLGKSIRRVQQLIKEMNITVVKGISDADVRRLENRKTQPGPVPCKK